jgi:hypothetical protein
MQKPINSMQKVPSVNSSGTNPVSNAGPATFRSASPLPPSQVTLRNGLRALLRPQHGIAHFAGADALATLLPDVGA